MEVPKCPSPIHAAAATDYVQTRPEGPGGGLGRGWPCAAAGQPGGCRRRRGPVVGTGCQRRACSSAPGGHPQCQVWGTMCVTVNRRVVLCLVAHCCASLCIAVRHCASLCVVVHRCASLCIAVRRCASLRVIVHRCASLCIAARHCASLRTVVGTRKAA